MPGPVQPVDYVPGPNGEPIPHFMNASPGMSGALLDAIRALSQAFAPKAFTQMQARERVNQQQAEGGTTPSQSTTTDLGNQF